MAPATLPPRLAQQNRAYTVKTISTSCPVLPGTMMTALKAASTNPKAIKARVFKVSASRALSANRKAAKAMSTFWVMWYLKTTGSKGFPLKSFPASQWPVQMPNDSATITTDTRRNPVMACSRTAGSRNSGIITGMRSSTAPFDREPQIS